MKWMSTVLAVLVTVAAVGMTLAPRSATAQPAPVELRIEATGPGFVVNGVLFEDALGLSQEEIVALVQAATTSLHDLVEQPEAVQLRVNLVLDALAAQGE